MSKYTQVIESANIAIGALKLQLKSVAAEVDNTRIDINERFDLMIGSVAPELLKNSKFEGFISESLIRFSWNRLSNILYRNSIDIYYYNNKHYGNRDTVNHRWEISASSNRIIVNTEDTSNTLETTEGLEYAKLVLNVQHFIQSNMQTLILLHAEVSENNGRAYDIQNTIGRLERDIADAEQAIERDRILRKFKPAGETASCLFNTDIKFPERTYYYKSRRTTIGFDGIKILKDTAKGIRVEFYNLHEHEGEIQRYASCEKWLELSNLIGLYKEAETSVAKKEARRIEREEAQKNFVNQY